MNNDKLSQLVSSAVDLDREIAQLNEKLDVIKKQLVAEARTRQEQAVATDGGGKSVTMEGEDGCIARVTTAGATLKATLKIDAKDYTPIKIATRGLFARLFDSETVFKPVPKFREQATELLGEADAKKLVKLCTGKGKTTVSFETKEAAT